MKALTLWQPWATLIVNGDKHIETRGHKTNIRGRVAIHAAKVNKAKLFLSLPMPIKEHFYKSGIRLVDVLPRGKVLGTVEIIGCLPIEELYGTVHDTPKERAFGDWNSGRYGWILRNPILFEEPVPAKGSQGFWNWEEIR